MSVASPTSEHPQRIEDSTIQPIPDSERHGKARDLFTIWFGSNIMVLTIVTGALATTVFSQPFGELLIADIGSFKFSFNDPHGVIRPFALPRYEIHHNLAKMMAVHHICDFSIDRNATFSYYMRSSHI